MHIVAKQKEDRFTLDLPGFSRPPGRPRLPKTKSGAQRTAEWRQRKDMQEVERSVRLVELTDVQLARYAVQLDGDQAKDCWLELGRRMGWR